MDAFYIGLHQPSDAQHFDRCCIHVGRLLTRTKPLGCDEVVLDSQAFRILELHGDHQLSPLQYAILAAHIGTLVKKIIVVTQDYMTEPYIFQKRFEHTGVRFTVADHQRLTIARYDALHYHASQRGLAVMPVLQGYAPHEYVDHIRQYGRRLAKGAWVGVGSVCKRNGDPAAIRNVLYSIKKERRDLRLHGFGLKKTALSWGWIRDALWSADSMAWSSAGRWAQDGSANDWRAADAYIKKVDGIDLSDLPMFQEAA